MRKVKSEFFPYLNEICDMWIVVLKIYSERLTLEEKFQIISGHMLWWRNAEEQTIKNSRDGYVGWSQAFHFIPSDCKNTQFPAGSNHDGCDLGLCSRSQFSGQIVGEEVRARKKHILLAPGINIHPTPLNGRTFEYYSEDPYLIRELIVPMVKAVQKGISVC